MCLSLRGFRLDSRVPITLPILDRLVAAASSLEVSAYQIIPFQVMCSLAFYASLCVGEITSVSKQGAPSPLQLYQLTKLLNAAGELTAFKVTFGNFKHSYNERPFSVVVKVVVIPILVTWIYCPSIDNHGQKSWDKFALLALLRLCQTRIQLPLPNLAPPHPPPLQC